MYAGSIGPGQYMFDQKCATNSLVKCIGIKNNIDVILKCIN